tara:strand:- start:1253 stop:1792 length:540 start_codon:yes stop_codon:yes gene_type:complete
MSGGSNVKYLAFRFDFTKFKSAIYTYSDSDGNTQTKDISTYLAVQVTSKDGNSIIKSKFNLSGPVDGNSMPFIFKEFSSTATASANIKKASVQIIEEQFISTPPDGITITDIQDKLPAGFETDTDPHNTPSRLEFLASHTHQESDISIPGYQIALDTITDSSLTIKIQDIVWEDASGNQ